METLYRKVSVSERLPIDEETYITSHGWYFWNGNKFEDENDEEIDYVNYWLEEIPDNSPQIENLEAEKEELLEALENLTEYGSTGEDAVEMKREIESLIQKHKQ